MKKIFFAFVIAASFTTVGYSQAAATTQAPATPTASKAAITFTADSYNFGTIPQGTPVTHVFTFKNTGSEPLVLSSVTASCGCTTPEWPKEPVKPGATASIKVTYNAAALNTFTKNVTVVSNASSGTKILTITGEVKAQAAASQTAAPAAASAAPKKN